MKPNEKRKSTQLGLGKVTDDPRHTSKRARVDIDPDAAPGSVPPISAPPPSGGPSSGAPAPRHTVPLESARPRNTRSIESSRPKDEHETKDDVRVVARTPSPPPATAATGRSDSRPAHERLDRIERSDDLDGDRAPISVRGGGPSSRTPIEVTQVDTKRIPRANLAGKSSPPKSSPPKSSPPKSGPPGSRPPRSSSPARDARFAPEEPTGRRPIAGRGVAPAETGSRPIAGRAASARPDRAPSGAPPQSGSGSDPRFARSLRPSIREDNVGGAVTADAVGAAARAIPKVLKTKAEIAAAPIDHRAGFLLAHIDGLTTVAGLVDICGMAAEEVNDILDRLRRLGIVAVR